MVLIGESFDIDATYTFEAIDESRTRVTQN